MGEDFGTLLRGHRERAGLTQEALAERAGLAVTAVSALERGIRRRPYPHTVRALADALGLAPEERDVLVAAVPRRSGPASDTASTSTSTSTSASTSHTATAGGGRLVLGRDAEVRRVAALLLHEGRRLVTLTGPGGVGKTSLARAVADAAAPLLAHGVHWVGLAAVRDPALVAGEVAHALGLPERPGLEAAPQVVDYLAGRRALLVLDNLEQVLGCAPFVADLVRACPGLLVLATSRAPLRVRDEHEVAVWPLAVPDGWSLDAGSVASSPAVALLVQRAAALGAPVEVTDDNAATLAGIAWRLDGLPLALELAAARLRLLSPAALLATLEDALSPDAGLRDLPERQQSVRATIDWSHDLLDDGQRRLFARLGAFAGPFTIEAASAVAADPAAVRHLLALVEQSLVVRAGDDRFRLLEPVRQDAVDRLAASGDATSVRALHAHHLADVAAASRPAQRGAGLAAELDLLEAWHADLREAFGHLAAAQPERAAGLAWDLWFFLVLRARGREWLDLLDGLDGDALDPDARCRLAGVRGVLHYLSGEARLAAGELAEARHLAVGLDDPDLAAELAGLAGLNAVFVGDLAVADEVLAAAAPASPFGRGLLLAVAGQRELLRGDLDRAAEVLGEAERVARGLGNPFLTAVALNMAATVTERQGEVAATAERLAESVQLSVRARMGWTLMYSLPALAAVAARLGEHTAAAVLLGMATAVTGSGSAAGAVPVSRSDGADDVAALRSVLGDAELEAAVDEGRQLGLAGLADLAERLRDRARG